MRAGGVETIYVTDNPIVAGPRFPDVRAHRRTRAESRRAAAGSTGARSRPIARQTEATERTFTAGIAGAARAHGRATFFVAVDPFDPVDAVAGAADLRQAGRGGATRASAR